MSLKKMLAVVAAASLVAVAAPAFAANPFSDVPMNHWAYDAVEQLSAKGILEGYPNGTFKGNRAMTRYEIATMVARMMAAGGLSGEDLEKLKALVVEFQPELEALGVKVDGFDSRLSALEKGVGGWKISGQMRFDYNGWDLDDKYESEKKGNNDDGFDMNRARLFLHRDQSDGVSFDARWHNDQFDRFWVTARDFFGLEGLTMRGGQLPIDWEGDDGLYIDNDAYFQDASYRGFDLKYNRGMFTIEGYVASNKGGNIYKENLSNEYYGARMKFDFNEKLWLSLNGEWVNGNEVLDDKGVVKEKAQDYATYWVGLGYKFTDGLELKGAYYMQDLGDDSKYGDIDDPKAWKVAVDISQDVLKFTSLWVEYNKLDQGFQLENLPWAFHNRRSDFEDYGMTSQLAEDLEIIGVYAKQKWNEKWSTFERYAKYDMDNSASDVNEWTVGLGYQYTPNLYFELAYNNQDGRVTDGDYENKQIRFRTLLNF